jgi:hypothetical protein
MQPVPHVLVVRRSAAQERRIQRDAVIVIITQSFNALMCLTIAFVLLRYETGFVPSWSAVVPLIATCFSVHAIRSQQRWRRVNREMGNLQLALSQVGVTYASQAGTYSAPWSAVRQIRIRRRPDSTGRLAQYLIVDVIDWGGPVGRVGKVDRLALSLKDSEVDVPQVRRAVHYFSSGRIMAFRD